MRKPPRFGARHWPFVIGARAALGILACALTALAYQRAYELPFVFDDRRTVLLNLALIEVWDWPALLRAWNLPGSGSSGFDHGAAILSYAWDRSLWGFSSFGFHLTNVILHIVVVALFYGTCIRALTDVGRGSTGGRPGSDSGRASQSPGLEWGAFFAAAAFGLHPLMSATALYVSARGDMIGAAAFMVALMFARRAILTSWTAPGLLAAGFGVAAFASSAAGAGLPLVLLTYDVWLLRTDGWRRRLWRAYVPAIAAVVLASGWRLSVDEPSAGGMFYTMLSESVVVWRYVALVAIPTGQSIVHDARSVPSLMDPFALVALAGIAAAVAGAIWLRRIAPLAGVGVIWCVAGLAATSIFPQRDLMAEPRAYLAAAGLMLAVFTTAAPSFVTRRAARIAGAAVLALLAVLTSMRLPVWSDPLRLWTEAVERSPGAWLAHAEFAEALKEAGQCDRAVKEAAIAGDLNPRFILDPAAGWAPCPRPAPAR